MTTQDIRWIQRLDHFNKAFFQLKDAVELSQQRKLSKLEEQGLIQAFEYTHELAWNTLKDFLFRSSLPTGEDAALQDNPKFWELIEAARNPARE